MEILKEAIKPLVGLLVMTGCVLFVIWAFFSASYSGGTGVFEAGGKIFGGVVGSDAIKNDGLSYITDFVDASVPVVKYNASVQNVGNVIAFKDLFLVQKADGTYVSLSTEDGITIYLMDIRNASGNSALLWLTSGKIAGMEEIPAPFIYDEELDLLYIFASGTYTVYIKIYGVSGGQKVYEFQLPVEAT